MNIKRRSYEKKDTPADFLPYNLRTFFYQESSAQTAKEKGETPNGCPGEWISDCNIKVKESANILRIGNTVLWPNPTDNHFNLRPLEFSEANVQVRVMNAQGQVVFSLSGNASQTFSFGETYFPGVYFVQIAFQGSQTTVKVLKL